MAETKAAAPATGDSIPYPGRFDIGDFEKRMGITSNIMNQLMGMLTGIDSFQNMLAARSDPTIPALLNSQLGNYVRFQNSGGVNANDVLSGNFGGAGSMLQPMSMGGDPNDPFSIPIQRPGGNAMTEQIFNQLLGPVGIDQISQYAQGLFGMHSPIPQLIPQTERPLPNVVAPTFEQILQQFGINQTGAPQMPPAPGGSAPQQPTQPQGPQMQMPGPPGGFVRKLGGQQVGQQRAPEPITSMPMPSFQQGTPYVPKTGPAMLHQGEAVVPAQFNPANAAPPGVMQKPPPMQQPEVFGGANTTIPMMQQAPAPAPRPMAPQTQFMPQSPNPMLQTSVPFDVHTGQPGTLPGDPRPGVTMPPPQQGGPANPLQMALGSLMMQLGGGGPINQNVQNIQQQQLADTLSLGKQQAEADLRARMGARGLGGSGLQFGLEQNLGNDVLRALTQGQNQIALDAAGRNYDALGNTANSLIGGSLGAGQFGLQQAAFNQNQSMSMFDQLLNAIRQSFANPSDQFKNTTNVAFV